MQIQEMLAAALGGRVAEELVFDEITTGASNDLEQATNIARSMVTRYGMSEKLGPRTFGKRDEMVFLGREISEQRDYSDKVAETIDEEVLTLITTGYVSAKHQLSTNMSKLTTLSQYLISHETAESETLQELLSSPDASPA